MKEIRKKALHDHYRENLDTILHEHQFSSKLNIARYNFSY